jgi:hypothetical protein
MKAIYKIILSIIIVFAVWRPAHSNDTVFGSVGNTLIPLQQTRISIEKEILKIKPTVHDRNDGRKSYFWAVDVYFEFMNPDDDRVLQVGFVTPPSKGPGDEEANLSKEQVLESAKGTFASFAISVNNVPVKYRIVMADDLDLSGFPPENVPMKKGDVVCLFDLPFKKGLNIVTHKYDAYGESDSMFYMWLEYRLKTGALWAGNKIKDFELYIEGDGRQLFYGIGFSEKMDIVGKHKGINGVYLKGCFVYKGHNFVPKSDIHLKIKSVRESDLELTIDDKEYDVGLLHIRSGHEDYEQASKSTLRILRNAPYAWHNYAFKSADLIDYYSKVGWYFPDLKVKIEDIHLSKEHQEFVEFIKNIERSK